MSLPSSWVSLVHLHCAPSQQVPSSRPPIRNLSPPIHSLSFQRDHHILRSHMPRHYSQTPNNIQRKDGEKGILQSQPPPLHRQLTRHQRRPGAHAHRPAECLPQNFRPCRQYRLDWSLLFSSLLSPITRGFLPAHQRRRACRHDGE